MLIHSNGHNDGAGDQPVRTAPSQYKNLHYSMQVGELGYPLLMPLTNTHMPTQVHCVHIAQDKQAKGEERGQITQSTNRMRLDDTL